MYISQITDELSNNGVYEVEDGVFFWTLEKILDEQEGWDDEDPCKNFDFSGSPFWVTYKEMEEPEPFFSLVDYIIEYY
jgi:hypothetical protein